MTDDQVKGRAQCLVFRNKKFLMVKHRVDGEEYWILPGGGIEQDETPEQSAVRELYEECGINGTIVRRVGKYLCTDNRVRFTYLFDVGDQQPTLGSDPEFAEDKQILTEVAWKSLDELSERDRAWLFGAGILCLPEVEEELESWSRDVVPPRKK